jgi:hypothetical protein
VWLDSQFSWVSGRRTRGLSEQALLQASLAARIAMAGPDPVASLRAELRAVGRQPQPFSPAGDSHTISPGARRMAAGPVRTAWKRALVQELRRQRELDAARRDVAE